MRRSRALSLFGCLLLILACATVSARSRAADRGRVRAAATAQSSGHAKAQEDPLRALTPPWKTGTGTPSAVADLPLLASLAKTTPPVLATMSKALPALPAVLAPSCPDEMVEVDGDYCPVAVQKCLRWLDPTTKLQCAEFDRSATAGKCPVKTEHKHFCVDRYEWPNLAGATPITMTNWYEAKSTCERAGKRLCSDTEWTLACEGQDRQPYPYGDGYARDDQACNIDKPYIVPDEEKFADPRTASEEAARLDQREPSGVRNSCVSPYGVHDMVGNVDEWVVNVSQQGKPFQSGLKGGYWGPVRTRCRPMTTAHEERFRYYQIGFRCCDETAGRASVAAR
jgi:sulfatase modifying factor 1